MTPTATVMCPATASAMPLVGCAGIRESDPYKKCAGCTAYQGDPLAPLYEEDVSRHKVRVNARSKRYSNLLAKELGAGETKE